MIGIHWKSPKSRVKTFRDVSNDIPKDLVFSKSPMGTPLDSIFFTHNFFFQLQSWAQGGIQINIWFCTIRDLPVWFFGNEGILVSQNSYGHTMAWSSSCMMMRRRRMEAKSCASISQNLLYCSLRYTSRYILVPLNFWQKSYGFTAISSQIFFRRKSY